MHIGFVGLQSEGFALPAGAKPTIDVQRVYAAEALPVFQGSPAESVKHRAWRPKGFLPCYSRSAVRALVVGHRASIPPGNGFHPQGSNSPRSRLGSRRARVSPRPISPSSETDDPKFGSCGLHARFDELRTGLETAAARPAWQGVSRDQSARTAVFLDDPTRPGCYGSGHKLARGSGRISAPKLGSLLTAFCPSVPSGGGLRLF